MSKQSKEAALAEFRSRVSDPKPTLYDDGRGVPEEALETGFIHWLTLINAHGDDGKQYFIEVVPMTGIAEAGVDLWMLEVGSERGGVVEVPGSVHKIASYPFTQADRKTFPVGTLSIERGDREVSVRLPGFEVVCKDDHTWHYDVHDEERKTRLQMVHHGEGFPTWYGKEKPKYLTAHSIAYGYNWVGRIEGTLTIEGREVALRGAALRERYVAVDTCAAEIGGWEDWMWFHFDEAFGSYYEMKFAEVKQMSLNLREGGQYFPIGDFEIEHHEWAFHPRLGAFVPTRYRITMEVEAGTLELAGDIVESKLWGMRGEAPDTPLYTHNFGELQGVFTDRQGRRQVLSNGVGGGCVRLWKPYPSFLLPQASEQLQAFADRVLLFE
ncbi:MAG: hypothetical protein R3F16_10730 [Myxococcota bacterium]